jgi:hypothetical protein
MLRVAPKIYSSNPLSKDNIWNLGVGRRVYSIERMDIFINAGNDKDPCAFRRQ